MQLQVGKPRFHKNWKKEFLKQLVNHQIIGLAPKPWDMYNNRKNNESKIEWETKILFFTLNRNIIDKWRWIFVQSMRSQKNIYIYEKLK
jgi:hypothetical protein